jgi:hypothetical protein
MMLAFFNSDDSSAQQGGGFRLKIKWWNHLMNSVLVQLV